MDADTKQILKSLCAVLRDSTEQAYRAHELAEKVYISSSHMVPGFDKCFQSPFGPELEHIKSAKGNLLQRLDEIIQSL